MMAAVIHSKSSRRRAQRRATTAAAAAAAAAGGAPPTPTDVPPSGLPRPIVLRPALLLYKTPPLARVSLAARPEPYDGLACVNLFNHADQWRFFIDEPGVHPLESGEWGPVAGTVCGLSGQLNRMSVPPRRGTTGYLVVDDYGDDNGDDDGSSKWTRMNAAGTANLLADFVIGPMAALYDEAAAANVPAGPARTLDVLAKAMANANFQTGCATAAALITSAMTADMVLAALLFFADRAYVQQEAHYASCMPMDKVLYGVTDVQSLLCRNFNRDVRIVAGAMLYDLLAAAETGTTTTAIYRAVAAYTDHRLRKDDDDGGDNDDGQTTVRECRVAGYVLRLPGRLYQSYIRLACLGETFPAAGATDPTAVAAALAAVAL